MIHPGGWTHATARARRQGGGAKARVDPAPGDSVSCAESGVRSANGAGSGFGDVVGAGVNCRGTRRLKARDCHVCGGVVLRSIERWDPMGEADA